MHAGVGGVTGSVERAPPDGLHEWSNEKKKARKKLNHKGSCRPCED